MHGDRDIIMDECFKKRKKLILNVAFLTRTNINILCQFKDSMFDMPNVLIGRLLLTKQVAFHELATKIDR